MEFVFLREIIDEMDLEIINESTNIDDVKIYSSELSRPGLQLVGFYEKFVPERLQVIGSAEWHYLEELSPDERYNSLDNFLSHPISALIISRDLPIFPEIYEIAQKHNRNVLKSKEITSKLFNKIISYVDLQLSLETRMHGVLVEVYGVGILIIGKSGVGKSETALDLVIRGHRLVSDDTVIIKRIDDMLQGKSPELTRHFMEIRGLGILDIERLYGVGSVKNDEFIEMVIRPGRNVAMIIEVAARNFRQKALGYNAANELNEKIMKQIEINKSNKEKEQGN